MVDNKVGGLNEFTLRSWVQGMKVKVKDEVSVNVALPCKISLVPTKKKKSLFEKPMFTFRSNVEFESKVYEGMIGTPSFRGPNPHVNPPQDRWC